MRTSEEKSIARDLMNMDTGQFNENKYIGVVGDFFQATIQGTSKLEISKNLKYKKKKTNGM